MHIHNINTGRKMFFAYSHDVLDVLIVPFLARCIAEFQENWSWSVVLPATPLDV